MLFKIYETKFVPRNIQYTGTWASLTYPTYECNIKHITENIITCQTNKIFYYAFSQNKKYTTRVDSWRTISIRYISNTTFELTLKQINILSRDFQNYFVTKTPTKWFALDEIENQTKGDIWESFQTKLGFQNFNEKIKQFLNTVEVPLQTLERGIYIQTAQRLSGNQTFSGSKYWTTVSNFTSFRYLNGDDIINTGLWLYFFPLENPNKIDYDKLFRFIKDLSGEELFVSAFLGVRPNDNDTTRAGFQIGEGDITTPPVAFATGVEFDNYTIDFNKGTTYDISTFLNKSQFAILSIANQNLLLFSSKITILPFFTAGKCLLLISSCLPQNTKMLSLPLNEFQKIFAKNCLIVDIFPSVQLSKTNLSEYYSNPYLQKIINFNTFENIFTNFTRMLQGATELNISKIIKSGANWYGKDLQIENSEYKARTIYNSANVSDFADIGEIIQNNQKFYISYLQANTSQSAYYMQPIASVSLIEEIFKSYSPENLKTLTGERIDFGGEKILTSQITFAKNNHSLNGFYKGNLTSLIIDNDTITANKVTEEDTRTANEGVWLISDFADLQQLINQI